MTLMRDQKTGMKMTCIFFKRNIIENVTLKFDLQETIKIQCIFETIPFHTLILSLHLKQTC